MSSHIQISSYSKVGFGDNIKNLPSQIYDPPQYNFTYTITNNSRQSIELSGIVFSNKNINETVTFQTGESRNRIVPPHNDSFSRSKIMSLHETSPCLEMNARLQYSTLPSHNSKVCFAHARFGTSLGGKGKGKGKVSRSHCTSITGGKGKKGKGRYSLNKGRKKKSGKGGKGGKGKGQKTKGKGKIYNKGKGM